jgi:hypothetical protein
MQAVSLSKTDSQSHKRERSQSHSKKRERFIQIGKHRFRIANDHHAALTELSQTLFRYVPMGNLLFLTSFVGAILLLNFPVVVMIIVRICAEGKR